MVRIMTLAQMFMAICIATLSLAVEEKCSTFSYEKEMISNMLKMELNVERMEREIKKRNEDIVKLLEAQRKEMEKFAIDYKNLRDILVIVMENKTAEVASVLGDKTVLDDKLASIDNTMKSITEKFDNVHKDNAEKKLTKTNVAFSAFITPEKLQVSQNQIIVFGSVLTNEGGGYNNKSGKFIAPVAGHYLISCSILSSIYEEFWATIRVNSSVKASLYEKGTNYGMASQTIVLELSANDVVTINSGRSTRSIYGNRYSTFSVVLIS